MDVKVEDGKGGHNVFVAFFPDWTRERAEELRDLCLGAVKLPIEDWRRINKALDKLEEEERKAAGHG